MKKLERLPLADVAALMNTTPLNVLMHIKRGLLQGIEEHGDWLVERDSLDALLQRTGGSRAENVCAAGCAGKHGCGSSCS
jgi:hypothetical protein